MNMNYMKIILAAVKTYIDKIAAQFNNKNNALNNKIPTKISQLENDKKLATEEYVDDAVNEINISGGASSWNDLEDKPFGEEYGNAVYYLEEQTFNLEYNEAWINIPLNDLVYVGNKYTVVFDDVEYEATLYGEEGGAFIGINYYYPSDNRDGLPFGLWFNEFASIDGELWGLSQLAAICTIDDSLVGEHTVFIYAEGFEIKKIDEKYLPDSVLDIPELKDEVSDLKEAVEVLPSKMDKENPIGSGSLNMNGKAGVTVGNYSTVLGNNSMSVGESSIASGHEVVSNYDYQSVFGKYNKYTTPYELVEEEQFVVNISGTTSIWVSSSYVFDPFTGLFKLESPRKVKIGSNSYTNYYTSETDGWSEYIKKISTGYTSDFRSGRKIYSKATENSVNYALMIGNGTSEDARSNAHTVDWEGNAWYQGNVYVGGEGQDDENTKKLATEEYVDDFIAASIQSDVYVINITQNTTENGTTYSSDKTFAEIVEAYNSGKHLITKFSNDGMVYTLKSFLYNRFTFHYIAIANNKVVEHYVIISNGSISTSTNTMTFGTGTLATADKTIIGAINELNAKHTNGTDSLILLSPNGTRFSITVGDDGVLTSTGVTE